ncbi:MAG: hypothetical protein K9N55_20340 [Phycisphaerae bacterium]|nr:hypothetical protein [Phycisphaerae bacterium]
MSTNKRILAFSVASLVVCFAGTVMATIGHGTSIPSDSIHDARSTEGTYLEFQSLYEYLVGLEAYAELGGDWESAWCYDVNRPSEYYYTTQSGTSWSYEAECSVVVSASMEDAVSLHADADAYVEVRFDNSPEDSLYVGDEAIDEDYFNMKYSSTISDSGTSSADFRIDVETELASFAYIEGDPYASGFAYAFSSAEWALDMSD